MPTARSQKAYQAMLVWIASAALCVSAALHAQNGDSDLPRHPLEIAALVEPERVLRELPAEIERATASSNTREVALLQLARANACRVVANWTCQRDAGNAAVIAARAAADPILQVRGLIAESRGSIARQDYTRGEHLLGDAQILLQRTPSAELASDVYLAYSSLSFTLGKHESAARYANLGLAELPENHGLAMRARLLRNRARAEAQLGQLAAARGSLAAALAAADEVVDPKLAAELALESARVARLAGDVATQRSNGRRVLELGAKLQNSQLAGLGHEVLGLAAQDAKQRDLALTELRAAYASFRELGLARDELRISRHLLDLMVDSPVDSTHWNEMVSRFLELDRAVIQSDRAKAADDYEVRLKYAAQEMDVLRLANEAELASQRELTLAQTNRLTRWLMLSALAVLIALGIAFVLQRRSNRQLQAALAARRESEAKATDLLRLSKGMVFLHDLRGELVMVNLATAQGLGTLPEQLVGRALGEFLTDASRGDFAASLRRLAQQQQDEGILVVRRADDAERLWRYSSRLSETGGYAIGSAVDITEQAREAEALRAESIRDVLTQAYNRRYLSQFAHTMGERRWAVINVDLDHFKQINDSEGHDAGDRVLIAMSRYLESQLRSGDALVRSGGDEFVLLLAHAEEAQVQSLLAKLRAGMDAAPCSYSIGHALRQRNEALMDTLSRADAEMYALRRAARSNR